MSEQVQTVNTAGSQEKHWDGTPLFDSFGNTAYPCLKEPSVLVADVMPFGQEVNLPTRSNWFPKIPQNIEKMLSRQPLPNADAILFYDWCHEYLGSHFKPNHSSFASYTVANLEGKVLHLFSTNEIFRLDQLKVNADHYLGYNSYLWDTKGRHLAKDVVPTASNSHIPPPDFSVYDAASADMFITWALSHPWLGKVLREDKLGIVRTNQKSMISLDGLMLTEDFSIAALKRLSNLLFDALIAIKKGRCLYDARHFCQDSPAASSDKAINSEPLLAEQFMLTKTSTTQSQERHWDGTPLFDAEGRPCYPCLKEPAKGFMNIPGRKPSTQLVIDKLFDNLVPNHSNTAFKHRATNADAILFYDWCHASLGGHFHPGNPFATYVINPLNSSTPTWLFSDEDVRRLDLLKSEMQSCMGHDAYLWDMHGRHLAKVNPTFRNSEFPPFGFTIHDAASAEMFMNWALSHPWLRKIIEEDQMEIVKSKQQSMVSLEAINARLSPTTGSFSRQELKRLDILFHRALIAPSHIHGQRFYTMPTFLVVRDNAVKPGLPVLTPKIDAESTKTPRDPIFTGIADEVYGDVDIKDHTAACRFFDWCVRTLSGRFSPSKSFYEYLIVNEAHCGTDNQFPLHRIERLNQLLKQANDSFWPGCNLKLAATIGKVMAHPPGNEYSAEYRTAMPSEVKIVAPATINLPGYTQETCKAIDHLIAAKKINTVKHAVEFYAWCYATLGDNFGPKKYFRNYTVSDAKTRPNQTQNALFFTETADILDSLLSQSKAIMVGSEQNFNPEVYKPIADLVEEKTITTLEDAKRFFEWSRATLNFTDDATKHYATLKTHDAVSLPIQRNDMLFSEKIVPILEKLRLDAKRMYKESEKTPATVKTVFEMVKDFLAKQGYTPLIGNTHVNMTNYCRMSWQRPPIVVSVGPSSVLATVMSSRHSVFATLAVNWNEIRDANKATNEAILVSVKNAVEEVERLAARPGAQSKLPLSLSWPSPWMG